MIHQGSNLPKANIPLVKMIALGNHFFRGPSLLYFFLWHLETADHGTIRNDSMIVKVLYLQYQVVTPVFGSSKVATVANHNESIDVFPVGNGGLPAPVDIETAVIVRQSCCHRPWLSGL